MELINNRYRVKNIVEEGIDRESYIVSDLQEKEKSKFLTIYRGQIDKKTIDFFTEEFEILVNIKHKNLINLEKFDIIDTMNLKKTGSLMYYYVLNEYIAGSKLSEIKDKLDLEKSLDIILQMMTVIDYLHFRGYSYKHLSPTNIYLCPKGQLKIKDLANIADDYIYSRHDNLTEMFIAPEIFSNTGDLDKFVDYYSLGMVMRHLLFQGLNMENLDKNKFKDSFNLDNSKKLFLLNIIKNLTHKDPAFRDISLKSHIQNIITTFELDYDYDLIKERDHLILNTKLIGRDREVNTLLEIDDAIQKGNKRFNGAIISGRLGSGKSKLLKELEFRYGLLNRSVFYIKGREDILASGLNIATLLKETFKNTSNEIIYKYRDDFNEILSKNPDDSLKYQALLDKSTQDKYRLYNRFTNYFADLSKDRSIYILIDNIDYADEDFLSFLNYMILKLDNHKVFFIITSKDPVLIKDENISKNISAMISNNSLLHLELGNLNEEDCGKFIKAILGINYIPKRFSSFIYKESLGNPDYVYYLIKDMYNREELFISEKGIWDTKEKDYNKIIISIDENHIINNQLKNIDEDHYKVLEVIALSKDKTSRKILMKVLDINEEDLDKTINSLIDSKIIDQHMEDSGETLYVNSRELKNIVDSKIDPDDKLILQKKSVEAIRKLYKDDYRLIIEELIHHLESLGQEDYALEILLKEANKQKNKYSDYSIDLWEHAYYLAKDLDNEAILTILDTLISIYEMKGYTDLSGNYIVQMYNIATEKMNIEYIVKAKNHQIENYLSANQLDIVERLLYEIETIVHDNNNLNEEKITLLMNRVKLGLDKSNFDHLEDHLKEAIKISKEKKIQKHLGNIYNLYGLYKYFIGLPKEAVKFFNMSIKSFDKVGNIVEEIKPINNIASIYANNFGQDEEALEYYKKGYSIAAEYGFAKASATFLSNIGDMYYNNLQLEDALRYFENARNITIDIGEYRGIVISNLRLGMVYLRWGKCGKAYEVYKFIKETHDKEPILDNEILASYHSFMGKFNYHYGKYDEALMHFEGASNITKGINVQEYRFSQSKVLILKAIMDSDYNRQEMEKIVNDYKSNKMTNLELDILLRFALLAVEFDDFDFAEKILDIFDTYNMGENQSLNALRDTIKASIDPSQDRLLAIEEYQDHDIYKDYDLYINIQLARLWSKLGQRKRSINNIIRGLDNIMKRSQGIQDKDLQYSFIKKRDGDGLKDDLSQSIKLEFNKDIKYISLDEAYKEDLKYNDLIYTLDHLSSEQYREIVKQGDKKEEMDCVRTLLDNLTDDNQRNLDLILDHLSYKILAKRGFILSYDEENNRYSVISSLNPKDTSMPKANILTQSNRSSVGILINKNLRKMEESNYIELLPDKAVSVICVPLFKEETIKEKNDRRKRGNQPYIKKYASFEGSNKIYIYLESDSYLNKFDYNGLTLIQYLSSLVYLNIENKYLKEVTIIDKLTGLLTRKYFDQQIDELIEGHNKFQGSFSLLMIDIDDFKYINDTYGHLKGDDVLSIIGRKLKESVRSTDLVARYGGEEFVVILFDTTIDEGIKIAEKIRINVSKINLPEIKREITVSVGLAQYPDHTQFKRILIGKADQALYHAKKSKGKNKSVIWNIDMGENIGNQNKLVGILTGNTNRDNVNISAVISMASLVENVLTEDQKIYEFIKLMLEVLGGQYATLIKCGNNEDHIYKTKIRSTKDWVKTPKLNNEAINKTIRDKKGDFFIDWDNTDIVDPITEKPQWQSVLLLPLVKDEKILALIYLSVPFTEKEFTFEDLNLGSLLSNIFVANLKTK